METNIIVLSENEQELEVNLAYDEITKEIEDAYIKERKNFAIDGFRKGKAPLHLIKKMYGDAIEYEASESIATKKFWDVVEEQKLKPISTPTLIDLDFERGTKLHFKVKFEVMPKIDIINYTGLEVDKPVFKVRDEDIEKEIDHLLKSHSKLADAELVENDKFIITVDLQRIDDDNLPVVGTRSENIKIDLSDAKVNPQIVMNVKDKKLGDSFNFKFFDEHMHGEEKHVEEFNYTGEIKKIEKIEYPEVTEELVQKISNKKSKTLDELKTHLRDNYEKYFENQSATIYTNALLNKIITNNTINPPKGYIQTILERLVKSEQENAKKYKTNFDEKAAREYLQGKAEWNAKWQIALENIAEKEILTVDDTEIEELAKKESEKTGISIEKLIKFYKETNEVEILLEEKVINFLKENNKVKEVDGDEKNN
ncbi:MAG: trigger factor [bacterium]